MKKIQKYTILLMFTLISIGSKAQVDYSNQYKRVLQEMKAEYEALISEIRNIKSPFNTKHIHIGNEHERSEETAKEIDNTNVEVSTAIEFTQPVTGEYKISSGFGYRIDPFKHKKAFHNGIDIPLPKNTPVLASRDGIVIKTGKDLYGGKYVKIKHENGYTTLYIHLSKFIARKGAKVKKGEIIGLSGNTGRSTGPHLHFEICASEKPINPLLILTQNFKYYEN